MADAKTIGIWRYDYELDQGSNWNAHIAAYSEDEAREYLYTVCTPTKINATSRVCRLDAITDSIRNLIVEAALPKKKKPGRPVGSGKKQEDK